MDCSLIGSCLKGRDFRFVEVIFLQGPYSNIIHTLTCYSISASPRCRKEFSTCFTLFCPDYFSVSFGKPFSLFPTAFSMNKIPFPALRKTYINSLIRSLLRSINNCAGRRPANQEQCSERTTLTSVKSFI